MCVLCLQLVGLPLNDQVKLVIPQSICKTYIYQYKSKKLLIMQNGSYPNGVILLKILLVHPSNYFL